MALTVSEAYEQLNLSVDLLPSGLSNRPGTRIAPTYITIHNTDNDSPGADALAHARYMRGPDAARRQVSWHFTVDDVRCIKTLPTSEKGWHAGSSEGNRVSMGIEICENDGIDQKAANDRAALLTALLRFTLDIPADRVVPHQHWTGKYCPHKILDADGDLGPFRSQVADYLSELQAGAPRDALGLAASDLPQLVDAPGDETETATGMNAQDEADLLIGRLYRENVGLRRKLTERDDDQVGGDCGGRFPATGDEPDGTGDISDAEIERLAAALTDEQIAAFHLCTEMPTPDDRRGEAITAAVTENPDNVVPPSETPALAAAVSAVAGPAIAVVTKKLWRPGRRLNVRFLEAADGYSAIPKAVKDKIIYFAGRWREEAGVNIEIVFGSNPQAEIRITNVMDGSSWSYLGTDALLYPQNKPTMNFGWLRPDSGDTEFSRVVVHEFGHALGAIHEHQNPKAAIPWNKANVYAYYRRTNGWDKATVDFNIFQRYSATITNSSQYDRLSIMHYAIPAEMLTDPRFVVGWNTRLSDTDKRFMRSQYPGVALAISPEMQAG